MCFATYAILQYERLKTNEENPEVVLKRLRALKLTDAKSWIVAIVQIFEGGA